MALTASAAAPVRIAYVIGGLGKGGAEYQLAELVRHLDPGRFAATVIALSAGGYWAERLREWGIPVRELPHRHRMEPSRLWRLRRALRMARPDILHTMLWPGNSYGRIAAAGLGIPVIVAAERNVIRRPWWQRAVERVLDRVTTAYLANADAIVRELRDVGGLPGAKMHVVYNGIDVAACPPFTLDRRPARRGLGLDPERQLVAQVGRLVPQKDYPTFLRAMALVAARRKDVDFLIVGDGPDRRQLEAAAARALGERVRFLGLRDDVPAILAAVDVLVLASRWEGMPNVVLEAMATGAVPVVTDVGGTRTLLRDDAGIVVPVGDAGAIGEAVLALLDDPERRAALARRGRTRVETEFSTRAMAQATMELYTALLAGARR